MDDRLKRLCLNATGMVLGKGVGLAVSLAAVPLVVSQLGVRGFGMWAVCQTLVTWVQTLDLGLGLGLQNDISHACNASRRLRAARSAGALQASMRLAAILVLGSALAAVWTMPGLLKIFGPEMAVDLKPLACELLSLTALAMALSLAAQTPLRIVSGLELLGRTSAAQAGGTLLGLAILAVGPAIGVMPLVGLGALMLLPVATQLVVALALLRIPIHRWARPSTDWTLPDLFRLVSVGAWFFASQIAALIVFQTDTVIVSTYLGPVEAGGFQATTRLFAILIIGQGIMLGAMWPAMSRARGDGDLNWVALTYHRATLACFAMLPIVIGLALAAPWLVEHWTGSAELRPAPVLVWGLAASCAMTLSANLHATCLNAVGAVRFPAVLALIQAGANLAAVLLAVRWWGAAGVAWASTACAAFTSVPLLWLAWRKEQRK